jgi:glycosyltransferase involved in cell wall biosynthesis
LTFRWSDEQTGDFISGPGMARGVNTQETVTICSAPAHRQTPVSQPSTATGSLPISVVIPAYNRADLVGRAIQSAQSQRPAPPAEIIVVDDCSSDATAAEAEKYGVVVVRHEENRGEAGARNSGLETARFDWVAFLDSDDEWLPDHLATLWPRRGTHVAVSATAVYRLDGRVRLLGHAAARPTVIDRPDGLVFPSNPMPLSGVLADRNVLLRLNGFRSWKTGADLDMWIRAVQQGTMLACPEPGYIYHVHGGQVSSDSALMRGNLLKLVESYSDQPWCTDEVVDRVAAVNAWDALQAARGSRDLRAAAREARWLASRPTRLRALAELWMWRFRLRRRTDALALPESQLPPG